MQENNFVFPSSLQAHIVKSILVIHYIPIWDASSFKPYIGHKKYRTWKDAPLTIISFVKKTTSLDLLQIVVIIRRI